MSQVLSLQDWYRSGPLASRMQLRHVGIPEEDGARAFDAGPVHLINVSCPPAVAVPPAAEYGVHLVLGTPPLLQVGFNRPPRWLVMSPGVFLVAPPDTGGDYLADAASHVLTMTIPKACVEDFTRDTGVRVEIRQEEAFHAPRLMRQMIRLWHELAGGAPASRMFADEVMRDALQVLIGRTEPKKAPRQARERLPAHTLRRLRDYVEGSLADDLDVEAMASVAALSPAHFARAFAATVGLTPFRYVMRRRLARARELLEHTDRSVLDIALDVGFKTPSHFTSRFRREFGVTPRDVEPQIVDVP